MTDKVFAYLLNLLHLGLAEDAVEQLSFDEAETLSRDEWWQLYQTAKRHAVVGVTWDGVVRLQTYAPETLHAMPAELLGKMFADVQLIERANSAKQQQIAKIQSVLRSGGYNSIELKGNAVAAYYPRPQHRQSADIDIWALPRIDDQGRLQDLSRHRQGLLSLLRAQNIRCGNVVYHHIEIPEAALGKYETELHTTPTWLYHPIYNSRLQGMFAEEAQAMQQGRAPGMSDEVQEIFVLLHALRHIYHDGLALRHLVDYYCVRNRNRANGVPVPTQVLRSIGMTTFARTMDELVDALFAAPQAGKVRDGLSPRAKHILNALPKREISRRVKWDYPQETLSALLWRTRHYLWRKANHYFR